MSKTYKFYPKMSKCALALFVTGSLLLPSSIVQAEEEFETVDLQKIEKLESEGVSTETNPNLIPGDFFYFAKIAFEKIKLALTFDDVKEAELLANYASERLAEASVLFNDGNESEALEVMEKAVEYMNSTEDIVADTSEEEHQSKETEELSDGSTMNPERDVEKDTETTQRQNIVALTAALEKVQNPKAKAALQKNIDKTYEKMAIKLENLNSESNTEVVAETAGEEEHELDTVQLTMDEPDVVQSETITTTVPAEPKANKQLKQEKTEAKLQKKQEKQAEIQQKKIEKQQLKQAKKNEKIAVKIGNGQSKVKNENKGNGQ
jgi:hypothetical protein